MRGYSRAGDATWFRVDPPGVALDVGRGAPRLAGCDTVLLSHGHLDHALGLPYLLSERVVHQGQRTRVLCANELVGDLDRFLRASAALEGSEYDYELVGTEPGDRHSLDAGMSAEAFAVTHSAPALGWHLWRRRKRLLPELAGLHPGELAACRGRGEPVDEITEELALSYCGDTTAEVLRQDPRLFSATILLLECTYLDPEHRERARRFGHLHLEDLVELEDRFQNEQIVLHHLSRRHTPVQLRTAVKERLPRLADRVRVWGLRS